MGKDLKLQVILNAVDKVSKPFKDIYKVTSRTGKAIGKTRESLKSLSIVQGNIDKLKRLKKELRATGTAFNEAQNKVKKLATATDRGGLTISTVLMPCGIRG